MSVPPGRPVRAVGWARIALAVGGLLLGVTVALIVWEAASGDPPPVVITGRVE